MRKPSLKLKILLSSILCVFLVGLFSNTYLYLYLTGIINNKAENIDALYLNTARDQLDWYIAEVVTLGSVCRIDLDVARVMQHTGYNTQEEKQDGMRARSTLTNFKEVSNISKYVNKLMIFNEAGLMVQSATSTVARMNDPELVQGLEIFETLSNSTDRDILAISPSISDNQANSLCIAYLSRVIHPVTAERNGWLYLEVSLRLLEEVIQPYEPGSIFITYGESLLLPADTGSLDPELLSSATNGSQRLELGGRVYRIYTSPLAINGLAVNSSSDITILENNGFPILYTLIVVLFSMLLVTVVLTTLLSAIITRPIQRLQRRIQIISDENDFSYDPSIEVGTDEIAQVGKVVNEMNMSIRHLLQQTEEMYEQRKNAEITLLQSQINPHFLYNTLDSVRWMAEIQGMPGIVKTVSSLSNLLRNLAKGVGDKITLEEELALLRDYVNTQSVRFMEMFEMDDRIAESFRRCKIIKFTLQPLVENAIFHGLEPVGYSGIIALDAKINENGALCITVEDNGAGMTEEELRQVLQNAKNPHPTGMSGMGVANVNSRLKLVYGSEYGLSYKSEKGRYTRASICIPLEREEGDV